MAKGTLFIISGPSGSGKDTVLKKLFEKNKDLFFSISSITREMRSDETQGEKYNFISVEEFRTLIDNNDLLEYNEYCGNFYGTPKKPVEEHIKNGVDVVLEVDVNGAANVRKKMLDAVSIFIIPPSFQELKKRLKGRGTEEESVINQRLKTAISEIKRAKEYTFVVVNDDVDQAVEEILSIIKSEKLKYTKQKRIVNEVLELC